MVEPISDAQVAILAGGLGLRLRPITEKIPKPMIEVSGKPILEWQLLWFKESGFRRFVFLVGYKREVIMDYFGDGSSWGVEIRYSVEEEPLGTGGALRNAFDKIDAPIILMSNGDIVTTLDPRRLADTLLSNRGDTDIVIASVELPSPYGVLDVGPEGRIRAFIEKPRLRNTWINAGVYAMVRDMVGEAPRKGDLEKTLFPQKAKEGRVRAVLYPDTPWISVDSFKDIKEAEKIIGRRAQS